MAISWRRVAGDAVEDKRRVEAENEALRKCIANLECNLVAYELAMASLEAGNEALRKRVAELETIEGSLRGRLRESAERAERRGYAACTADVAAYLNMWRSERNPARSSDYDEALFDVAESIEAGEHVGAAVRKDGE